jgi:nucleoside-diphosphate-sugar epimerase
MPVARDVFVTGGTGYLGRPLLSLLAARGHSVRALVRPGSEQRLPAAIPFVLGDPLIAASIARELPPSDTLVHLVGTPRPSPAKAAEFARVDGPSAMAALEAAVLSGVRHFIYVSVAHPAPMMHAYIAVRRNVEDEIQRVHAAAGITATILRPWYVLGPGHQWPHLLRPLYAIGRLIPSTRSGAERLGLVTHAQMVRALANAVENPPIGVAVLDVPAIRRAGARAGLRDVAPQ